jgi:hypothetical protein
MSRTNLLYPFSEYISLVYFIGTHNQIIKQKPAEITSLCDEQQGFRTGISCADAIVTVRQITETALEYNSPQLTFVLLL